MALTRVTVNLTPRSVTALHEAAQRSGLTQTDIINRAIQLYDTVDGYQQNGGALYIRPSETAPELERMRIF